MVPCFSEDYTSSWAQYCIQLKTEEERDSLQAYLKEQGIPTMVYYPKPMHRQEAFSDMQFDENEFEVTNHLCNVVLELPMHPYITDDEIAFVSDSIVQYLGKNR